MWLFIYIFYVFQSVYCHYGPFSYHYQSQTFPGRGSGGSSGVGMGCKSCLEVVFFFFFPQTPVTLFWYWMYVWEKASGPQCCKSQCLYRALFLNFFFLSLCSLLRSVWSGLARWKASESVGSTRSGVGMNIDMYIGMVYGLSHPHDPARCNPWGTRSTSP